MEIKKIIKAWRIANSPEDVQKELSELRMKVCLGCEFKKEILKNIKISIICTKCGCPLIKKIFTNEHNPCPMRKWGDVDKDYFIEQKSEKTLL